MSQHHKVIIAGSGLAALAAAARLHELGVKDIAIYANGLGGTPYIAAINFVLPENPYGDTPELYAEDMLKAGYNIGNKNLVREMAANTFNGYELLCRWAVTFAHNEDGSIKLRHVSGHTYPRSLCQTTNLIGVEIEKIMLPKLAEAGIEFHNHAQVVNLLTNNGKIEGFTVIENNNEPYNVYAPIVIASWGGVGNLLGTSTYPDDVKGNTLGMAKQAGANLVDIEFIEFVKYCRKLKFEEKPDYDYLRGLMINCISKNKKSFDNFYNLDILKNPLFHSQENKKAILIEYPLKNVSKKKNNRCKSTKRYKVNFEDKLGVENIANNVEYENKIISDSRSSSLGYIEEKVRSYSLYKKRGIEEIKRAIKNKNKKNDKNINLRIINKNQTVYRNPNEIKASHDDKPTPTFKIKKNYRRTRFEFIKRSLGIDQKSTEMGKSSSYSKNKVKDNACDSNENNINSNNINDSNKKDDGCSIL